MRFKSRPISLLLIVVLALALLAPAAAFAGGNSGKPQAVQASSTDTGDGVQLETDQKDTVSGQVYGVDAAESQSRDALREDPGSAGEENGGSPAKGLPVLMTEPADGAVMVRPDAEIRIVFDTESKAFKHVSKQLEKGHFYVTLNGRKVEAAYNGRDAVEAKPDLLQRYTDYTVEFVLHPDDPGKHLGFGNSQGNEWENKTCWFSFETGSALHEPRHVKISVSSTQPRVTEGAEIELAFTDDYGQPGWGARGRVILTEQGSKPDTAVADPSEFAVPERSDGKVRIRVSDTEAEKVSYRVEVSGSYPEDAARFDGEIAFRPGPAAKVSLSLDREKVVAGQKVVISGAAEDVYGNPVEDGTPVLASVSAGQVSGASTSGGAFVLEFTAPTKRQTVALTVRVDQAEAKLDVPVIADAPARVTVVPEKTEAEVGQTVSVAIYVEDKYGNPVEDGTKVAVSADLSVVAPAVAETKDGMASVQIFSDQAGTATVTATTENGVFGSAAVTFKAAAFVPGSVVVMADKESAPADGQTVITITAEVRGQDGSLAPDGTEVAFSTTLGTLSSGTALTSGGLASVTLVSGTPGVAVVTASCGDTSGQVEVEFRAAGVVVAVAPGGNYCLAVKSDGTVWAWGMNSYGQLGDGTTVNRTAPVQVKGPGGFGYLTDVVAVAAGWLHSLALRSDGTVWTWGDNFYGQLGDGTTTGRKTPVQVKGPGGFGYLTDIVAVAVGGDYCLALKSDGTVWAWGRNDYGQLGDGTTANRSTPVQVKNLTGMVAVAAGSYHSFALRSDGTIWAWGHNGYGQLGDGTTISRIMPVQVKGPGGSGYLTDIVAVAAWDYHSLALKSDGTVWAWGRNSSGQLGDGTTTNRYTPVQVKGPGGAGYLADVVAVAAGGSYSLALRFDGTVWAWGSNTYGQLGDGTYTYCATPVQVRGPAGGPVWLADVTAIAARGFHSHAVRSDGTVWAWGDNGYGQLGDGTTLRRTTPVQTLLP